MFQSQLESQESLKVSFVSLNKDICDADVSVCKDEAAFTAERLSVCPELPPQQPMLAGPQHIGRPEGALHTACTLSGLIPFIGSCSSLLTELAQQGPRVGRVVISTLES